MARPVLVASYTNGRSNSNNYGNSLSPSLPPISAYAFANIIRSADGPELQSAIDGITEICAKNKLSLAEEYGAHMPPVGEITEASSKIVGTKLRKPGMRRALTSVPEGSSESSEGSRQSKRRRKLFGFGTRREQSVIVPRTVRIGSMGRTIPIGSTTALSRNMDTLIEQEEESPCQMSEQHQRPISRCSSAAAVSLQKLLGVQPASPG